MLSSSDTNELAPAFHTGSLERPCVPCVQQNTRLRAFWPEPVSIFGSLGLTMLMAVHLYWAFHPACPSDRIDARSLGNHLTAFSASQGCQDFVPAASDKTVTSFAGAGRLLRTESQVWFMLSMSYQTITVTPSFHTQALPLIRLRFWGSRIGREISAQKLLRAKLSIACLRTVHTRGLWAGLDWTWTRINRGRGHGLPRANSCSRLVRGKSATAENCAALARLLHALQVLMKIRGKAY